MAPPCSASARLPASSAVPFRDRKSTRLNSSHVEISYAVFCLKKQKEYLSLTSGGPVVAGDVGFRLLAPVWSDPHRNVRTMPLFFFYDSADHEDLHSFPPRRPSD